jgi:shikimate kinase
MKGMRGVGRAQGAITIVNALPTGIGCAVAIALPLEATVTLAPASGGARLSVEAASDSPLSRATLLSALRTFAPQQDFEVTLSIRSRIPAARGLKSSSAVGVGIVSAVAAALGARVTADQIAALAADVSQEIGLSATGAFDDALASTHGGLVIADSIGRRLVRREPIPADWTCVLLIPAKPHPPSRGWLVPFQARERQARGAVEAALSGDYARAMARNSEIVEEVMGYNYRAIREELRRRGAIASGVSGMGPTLAAIGPPHRVSEILSALPRGEGDVIAVDFISAPPTAGAT